jgi:hypothetical protein
MTHAIHRVASFEKTAPYTLRVHFEDESAQTIDFRPVLKGDLYGPLLDESLFDRVGLDPEVHTLVWPNGADFDPAILHDWPQRAEDIKAMARRWEAAGATAD